MYLASAQLSSFLSALQCPRSSKISATHHNDEPTNESRRRALLLSCQTVCPLQRANCFNTGSHVGNCLNSRRGCELLASCLLVALVPWFIGGFMKRPLFLSGAHAVQLCSSILFVVVSLKSSIYYVCFGAKQKQQDNRVNRTQLAKAAALLQCPFIYVNQRACFSIRKEFS